MGAGVAPVFLRSTVRARMMYAAAPAASVQTTPWYAGSGAVMTENLSACAAQSNLPESTMTPPRAVPWPPMYLVVECTTMSAPWSKGRHRIGVGTVLSTMSGRPSSCAFADHASRSMMLSAGLPIDSQNTSLVFSSTTPSSTAASSGLTKRASMPNWARVLANSAYVPPYNVETETMLSPVRARLRTAYVIDAAPDEVASAPTPPSRAATRSSRTDVVGFMSRV